MSDSPNGGKEASAPNVLPLASLLRDGPPPSKRKRTNDDSENESEAESTNSTNDQEVAQERPIDQEAAQDRTEPAAQNTILDLRQLLLNPLIEDESIDLFDDNQELSYDVGSPWKEFTGNVLETQSATLKDRLEEKITSMLRVFGKVSSKERTIADRKKPVKDPDGNDKVFIPAKHRRKPTVTSNDEFNDNLLMKALVEQGRKNNEEAMKANALLDLKMRERERVLILERLRHIIHGMARLIAKTCIVKGKTLTRDAELDGEVYNFHLDDEMLTNVIACSILLGFKDRDAKFLGVKGGDELVNELYKLKALDKNSAKIKEALEHEDETDTRELVDESIQEWIRLFPAITVTILRTEDIRYRKMREEADIKETLEKEAIEDATAEVQEAFDTVDETTGLPKPVTSAIRNESKRSARKAVTDDKRRMQKNLRAMPKWKPRRQGP